MKVPAIVVATVLFLLLLLVSPQKASAQFGFQKVAAKAQALAQEPSPQFQPTIPDVLKTIDYDSWRDIRFRPEHALWKDEGLPFTVQFFHPGFIYNRSVKINIVTGNRVEALAYSSELFSYGKNDFKDTLPADIGFAGFRLHYPINTKDYHDEVIAFLGASYIRAVAQDQQYGIFARGLAIDTAGSRGEEFPYFTEFWIVKPSRSAKQITLYALMESNSLTGAYSYVITPGKETVMDVKSVLYKRNNVEKLGIAPLTSMFFYGENTRARAAVIDDFRPEVHDSDGLLIAFRTGEWLWRPLTNPHTLQAYSFEAPDPVGFGLFQRDRDFANYQDLEARFDCRPSVWITPKGKWGKGHIELIEIPTDKETNDNIVAFWVPEEHPEADKPLSFLYTMSWHSPFANRPTTGRVVSTRTAKGTQEGYTKFVIDFAGEYLESLPPDKALTAVITVDNRADLVEHQLFKNRVTKGLRLVFQVRIEKTGSVEKLLVPKRSPLELRVFLKEGENVISETWSYAYEF